MENNIKNRITLIIGASGGIGGAVARRIVVEGGVVLNASRTECNVPGVVNFILDVTQPDAVEKVVGDILTAYGHIDNLIYSAGDSLAAPLELTKNEDMRHIFEVNLFGFIRTTQAVLPEMRARRHGRIIAISSVGGTLPIAFMPFYSASKAALDMLVTELNLEVSGCGITVTSVLPGATKTQFTNRRKIYAGVDCDCYAANLERATAELALKEQRGDDPKIVAGCVLDVLQAAVPPVIVTAGIANKLTRATYVMLPKCLSLPLTKKAYDIQ